MAVSRSVRWVVSCVALLGAAPAGHAIHSTVTDVEVRGAVVTLRMRVFADDLAGAVAARAGTAVAADSSVSAGALDAYVRSRVSVRGGASAEAEAELVRCGVRRVGEVYVLCYAGRLRAAGAGFEMRQGMLTEWHADQVNVVRVRWGDMRRTVVFTRSAAAVEVRGPV